MTDRPYQDFSEMELRDLEQNLQEWSRQTSQQIDAMWTNGTVSDRTFWQDEDYQKLVDTQHDLTRRSLKVSEEKAARREERRRKREQPEGLQ
jgi:hypothetical protein